MALFSRPSEWQYLEGSCQDVYHTWRASCLACSLELTLITFYEGVKIYLPLYLISEISRHQKFPSLVALVRVMSQVVRSSLFLGSNMGASLFFICLFRRLIGRFYFYTSVYVPSILGTGVALLVERKGRRVPLAGYTAPIALEQLFRIVQHRNLVSGLPHGEVAMFSFAMAVLFHQYRTEAGSGSVVSSILRGLLRPQMPSSLQSSLQHTVLDNRLAHILLVGVWAFVLGYLTQTVFSLFSQRTREKGEKRRFWIDPQKVKFAAFFSSLAAGYKLVNSVLYYLPLPRDIRLLLAGLAAGLSMFCVRSTSISLYVAWKALEVLYSKGVERGWLRYLPHAEVLIYAMSTGFLVHGWMYEAHNMRSAYWHFLKRISWGRLLRVNYAELDKFGTGSSIHSTKWLRKQEELEKQFQSSS